MDQTLLDGLVTESTVDPNKDYLADLVGEGKKFKTDKELARGKYESDLYIKTLEKKQDELRADYLKLREDYTARAKLEDLVDQLASKPVQQPLSEPPIAEVKDKPGYDPKEIESLVSNKIQEYELTKKQTDNFNTVRSRLREQFGDKYQDVLKQQIQDLGLSEEDVNALARKSPTAFFKTIGIDKPEQQQTFQTPPASSVRSDSFAPKGASKRTWNYYQEMKKNNPKQYYDPKTNVQMHNDYIALGKEFEDGDFGAFG